MASIEKRIPIDFSHCGYRGGGLAIPHVPAVLKLQPIAGDATDYIQSAIDQVAKRPLDENGVRGAVVLTKGTYELSGRLQIQASGIVLRGEGDDENGTVLVAKGVSRRPLISVGKYTEYPKRAAYKIVDKLVPVGATTFSLKDASSFKVGDRIWIERPTTLSWVKAIGMDHESFGRVAYQFWANDSLDAGSMWWDREIIQIEGNTVTIDVPITTALESAYGGGRIYHLEAPHRLQQVGIEQLCLVSDYDKDNKKDENHAWTALQLRNTEDAWVRHVSATHFADSAIALLHGTKRITVADCRSYAPVSEDATGRGRAFYTLGQQTLFLRCYAEQARHDFTAGRGLIISEFQSVAVKSRQIDIPIDPAAVGPNAFVGCRSVGTTGWCGPLQYWSSGVLYDQMEIEGAPILMKNVGTIARASGWNGANSVVWNSQAERVVCEAPPTAQNWAVGNKLRVEGNGQIADELGELPPSLYEAQLIARKGEEVVEVLAAKSIAELAEPAIKLKIEPQLNKGSVGDSTEVEPEDSQAGRNRGIAEKYHFRNGWFVFDDRPIWGFGKFTGYWQMINQRASITRNGLEELGQGKTELMPERIKAMTRYAYPLMYYSFGLWYDRRRDLHLTDPQPDGNLHPPFYEMPWARSGEGMANDGLSKYDLTKFNSFYFEQLESFVKEAHENGVVLMHNYYMQHCITGGSKSHYVDFPWRPANCIQPVEMPDEIQAANAFYDVSIPLHRELHRKYIFKCLDVIGKYDNVVHLTSAEYTGPASFVKFWTDTIHEWERANGRKVKLGLGATKDVTEEILADSHYKDQYDVIEMTYWNYNTDGTIEACEGGKEIHFGWPSEGTSPEKVYEQMKEARLQHPDKGLIKMITLDKEHGGMYCDDPKIWREYALACLMGGGAIPAVHTHVVVNLDRTYGPPLQTGSIQALYHWIRSVVGDPLLQMKPIDVRSSHPKQIWALGSANAEVEGAGAAGAGTGELTSKPVVAGTPAGAYLVCYLTGGTAYLPESAKASSSRAEWFHIPSGLLSEAEGVLVEDGTIAFEAPDEGPWMLYISDGGEK